MSVRAAPAGATDGPERGGPGVTGLAEPVLFLPGMMCDAGVFGPQIAALSGQRTVHAAPVTGAESIEEIADQVLADAPPRFAVVGHGLGGNVAMELALRAPERVTRMALISTNPLAETPETAAAREPQIAGAKAGRLEEVIREDLKPDYLAPGYGRVEVLNAYVAMAMALGPEVYVRQSRAMQRRPEQRRGLRTLQIPSLVLCGRHDGLNPVRRHELTAELIPGAALEIVEEAGCLPTLEAPEAVTGALERWLNGTLLLKAQAGAG